MSRPSANPGWDSDDIRGWEFISPIVDDALRRFPTPVCIDVTGLSRAVVERILDTYGSVAAGWSVSIEWHPETKQPFVKLR